MSDYNFTKDSLVLANHQLSDDLKTARKEIRRLRNKLVWNFGYAIAFILGSALTSLLFIVLYFAERN